MSSDPGRNRDSFFHPAFSSNTTGAYRRALFTTMGGSDPYDSLSDDVAETDQYDREIRSERAHGNQVLDRYMEERGLQKNDPWQAFRLISGDRVGGFWLNQQGIAKPDKHSPMAKDFEAWTDAFEKHAVNPYINATWDERALARGLGRYALGTPFYMGGSDPVSDPLRGGRLTQTLTGGARMERHLDAMLGIMGMADTSLDVAMFSFEQPTVIEALGQTRWAQERGLKSSLMTRVRTSNPFSLQSKQAARLLNFWRNDRFEYSASGPIAGTPYVLTDHFKAIGANLRAGDLSKRAMIIGSSNVTQAALGKGVDRYGRRWGDHGSNKESMFVLSHDLVRSGAMREDVFRFLTEQGAEAMDWATSGDISEALNAIDRFIPGMPGAGARFKSRILDGSGIREMHRQMFAQMGAGDSAVLTTFNVGDKFLDELVGTLKKGAKITLYHGARYDFANGVNMTAATPGAGEIAKWQASMQARGLGHLLSNITFVQNQAQLVHAKVSMFEVGGKIHRMFTSMNFDNEQWEGWYDNKKYPGMIRQMGIYLDGDEYDRSYTDHLGARRDAELEMLRGEIVWGKLFKERAAGYRVMADAGWDRAELYGVKMLQRVHASDAMDLSTRKASLNAVKLGVGGLVSFGAGRQRSSFDFGSFFSLTLGNYDLGPGGSLYAMELSKFITPAYGVSQWKRGDKEGIAQADGMGEYSPQEVAMAAVGYAQREFESWVKAMALDLGAREMQARLADPVFRGALKRELRDLVESRLENFAGLEPGVSAYGAKQHARLGFIQRKITEGKHAGETILDMTDPLAIDANSIERMISSEGTDDRHHLKLTGKHFFFSAGGLSSFSARGERTPSRFYDMSLFSLLPMAAKVQRDKSSREEYLFLLPGAKLEQLPQRLQNIMSARNLTAIEEQLFDPTDPDGRKTETRLYGESRLIGQDGTRMKGIRFRGFMVPGMTGDNAYLIGERFHNAYFGDEAWRKEVKIPMRTMMESSGAAIENKLQQLVDIGVEVDGKRYFAKKLTGGRIFLDAHILKALNHQLPVALHHIGDTGNFKMQAVDLGTGKYEGTGLILNASELTARQGIGTSTLSLRGTLVRRLTSGDRSILGGKFPYAFVSEDSAAYRAALGAFHGADQDYYRSLQMGSTNVMFGSGTLKTGQAFIETGIEMLTQSGEGRYSGLMYQRQLSDLLGGADPATKAKNLVRFAGMFQKFMPYMDATTKSAIQPLMMDLERIRMMDASLITASHVAALEAKIRAELDSTSKMVQKLGALKFAPEHGRYVAGAALAFGIHALHSIDLLEKTGKVPELYKGFATPDKNLRLHRLNLDQMSTQEMLSMVYMSFVSAPSAAAVAMSSRDRVNFLHYHSGGYTDAFFDMMAVDPRVKRRAQAYQELLVGGLLGRGGMSEISFAGVEFNPMTRFETGHTEEFSEILRITRELQGYGRKKPVDARRRAYLKSRYDELNQRILDRRNAPMAGNPMDYVMGKPVAGSTASGEIQEFLSIQERAGVGSRTMYMGQLGRTVDGVFTPDASGNQVRQIAVKFISPKSLKALGSFEDFSHEMQRLQMEIERRMGVLDFIVQGKDGRIQNRMNELQQQDYDELMRLIGELQAVQGQAAVSDMQKVLGGQLAVGGRNMVIGTLPDIEHGTMIVGDEIWSHMRKGAAEEILTGLRKVARKTKAGSVLTGQASPLGGMHASKGMDMDVVVSEVRALIGQLQGEAAGTSHMRDLKNLADNLAKATSANRSALVSAELRVSQFESDRTAAKLLLSDAQEALKTKQRTRSGLAASGHYAPTVAKLDLEIAMIQKTVASHKNDVDLYGRELDRARQLVRAERKSYLQAMQETSVETLERILDNQWARNTLVHGLFQRAGAPMGPMGLVAARILTTQEYNEIARTSGKGLLIDTTLSARSVFMSMGSMAFNLGDFDGDTGSITWFHQFSRMRTLEMLGESRGDASRYLDKREVQLLANARRKLNLSMEETGVEFARYLTGWDHIFNEGSLYYGDDTRLRKYSVEGVRTYLHGLESSVNGLLQARGERQSQIDLDTLTQSELDSLKTKGVGAEDIDILKKFRARKAGLYGLSLHANKYSGDLYELHQEIGLFAQENRGRYGSLDNAFDAYFRGAAGAKAIDTVSKSAASLFGSGSAGGMRLDAGSNTWADDRPLTHNALMTFFVMTAFASTTLISKIFEVSYTARTMIDARRGRTRSQIHQEALQTYGKQLDGLTPAQAITALETRSLAGDTVAGSLVSRYRDTDRMISNLEGMLLTAQQIAREAIKPKDGGIWDQIDAELKEYGDRPDFVVSGKKIAKQGARYQGLEMFYRIIEGRDFAGRTAGSNINEWVHDSETAKGRAGITTLDQAHAAMKNMLVDFYGGQTEAMFAAGLTDREIAERLAVAEKDSGIRLFGSSADAEVALKSAASSPGSLRGSLTRMAGYDENKLKIDTIKLFGLAPNVAPSDSQVEQARKILTGETSTPLAGMTPEQFNKMYGAAFDSLAKRRYGDRYALLSAAQQADVRHIQTQKAAIYETVEKKASERARDMIFMGIDARKDRSARNDYMNALASGDAMQFSHVSGMLNRHQKMQIISASAARGKFDTDVGLKHALTDLFSEFNSVADIRASAETVTSSASFVDQIGRVFEAYKNTGSASTALDRVQANTRVGLLRMDEQIGQLTAAGKTGEAAKFKAQRDELASNLELLDHMKNTFMGGEETGMMPRKGVTPDIASIAGKVDKHLSGPKGNFVANLISNVLIPAALTRPASMMVGGMAGIGGEQAANNLMDHMAGHVGQMAGFALQFANPANMLRDAARFYSGTEGAVHLGITAASFGAGMAAGHWGGQAVAKHMTSKGMGTPGSGLATAVLAASAVGGFAAGSVVAAAATGLAMKFGWLKNHSPMRVVSPEMHDMGNRFLENESALDETFDLSDVEGEEVVLQSPDGEVLATGFYVVSWASRDDGGGFDTAGTMDADMDTHVSQGSYEATGNARDTVFDLGLDAQTGTRA